MTEPAIAQHLIDGSWAGEADVERGNPARAGEVAVVSPRAGAGEVDAAVTAACSARDEWSRMPAPARGAILMDAGQLLRERSSAIAEDLVREEGKTLPEAAGEVRRASDVLRFFGSLGWAAEGELLPSGFADTTVQTRREPLGTIGLITPWNFPIAIPAWKAAPALVAGNTVVLKPAELTPMSSTHLVRALVDAGIPAGVINLVHGRGSVVGDALVRDERIAAVSFTGSTAVGSGLRQTLDRRNARAQLEMGGKNGVLVLDDADPVAAARVVAAGAFGLTGQACTATSRVYCTPGIRERFLAALREEMDALVVGDGLDPATRMGPVVSDDQLRRDVEAVEQAVADGARLHRGSGLPRDGRLLEPVVLTEVAPGSAVVREEVFGPVLAVVDVPDYESGLAEINDSRYGLAAGICTTSLPASIDFARRAQAGVIKVNRPTTGLDLNVPFGGVKESSTNTFREQGRTALDFYTWGKTVYVGV